jgi:hypothetical protein
MKKTIIIFSVINGLLFASCKQDSQEMRTYIQYVDSLQHKADSFHQIIDTIYIETPIDPEDPTITRVDTIFEQVYAAQNLFYYKFSYAGLDLGLVNKREEVMQRYQSLYTQINQEALSTSQKKSLEEKANLFHKLYTEYLPDSVK